MKNEKILTHKQPSRYSSPWPLKNRIIILIWKFTWAILCSWTPKPFNKWRIFWLKIFGTKIFGNPFVHQNAKIHIPWHLTLHNHACLGDGAVAYSLGKIVIKDNATVAQEAYLCTGTHDFTNPHLPLQTEPIIIYENAFIGARAFIMPGVIVGESALVGACSVVTKDVPPQTTVTGNPAHILRMSGVAKCN